jgi:HNH endonuclease
MSNQALPDAPHVDVGTLAGIFRDCTNSYKFVWFLAIVDAIQDGHERRLDINHILYRIASIVWYPVNYFRLSFGKQDKLSQVVETLRIESQLPRNATPRDVVEAAQRCERDSLAKKLLRGRGRYVPYRFLRPFFGANTRGIKEHRVNAVVKELADRTFETPVPPMYRFHGNDIELSRAWFDYLLEHCHIVRGFCLWHFALYLQKRNPNVCNVAGKLSAPVKRDLSDAKDFWHLVFQTTGPVRCIYSNTLLDDTSMSADHFVPWSFVAHDELWNICPTTVAVNSSKNDSLPALRKHLRPFAEMQYRAVTAVAKSGETKLLEGYALLFGTDTGAGIRGIGEADFVRVIEKTIKPQMQIARNCGFPADWRYSINQ